MKATKKFIKVYETILKDNNLNINQKIILSLIYDTKNCFFTDKFYSELLNINMRNTRKEILYLKSNNYITITKDLKNHRTITSNINLKNKEPFIKAPLLFFKDIKELNNTQKLLCCLLMNNERNFITNKFISQKLNITERQTQRILKDLKNKNYIQTLLTRNNKREIIETIKLFDLRYFKS